MVKCPRTYDGLLDFIKTESTARVNDNATGLMGHGLGALALLGISIYGDEFAELARQNAHGILE